MAQVDVPATAASAATVRPISRQRPPRSRPAGSFTDVAEGETLSDVARRVYGSTDATDALWLANRDQLDRPDARLRSGTTLRTP
jgi:nucleoid-associated protein YgaU